MRALHVVGVSDDGTQLLLAASQEAERPSHALPLDGRLLAAARGELNGKGPRESALSPKEIQARLRAGDTVEDVAKAAGVPLNRVQRYAGPVLSERERVLEDARATVPRRDRGGSDGEPLGAIVDRRLAATVGLKPDSVAWSARRREDGSWVIALDYRARGGARQVEWEWHPAEHLLRALSAGASRLTAPDPAARAHRTRRATETSRSVAGKRRTPSGGTRRRAKPAKAVDAAKPGRTARATGKSATRTAKPRKSVTVAPSPEVTELKSVPRVRREPRPAPVAPRPPTTSSGRVEVPSWSDVLFGVGADQAADEAAATTRPAARAGRKAPSAARSTRSSRAAKTG